MDKNRILISTTDWVEFTERGIETYIGKFPNKVIYDIDFREECAIKLTDKQKPLKYPILSSEDYGDELKGENLNKLFKDNKLKDFNVNGKVSKTLLTNDIIVGMYEEDKGNFKDNVKLIEVEVPEGFGCIISDKGNNKGMKVTVIKEYE